MKIIFLILLTLFSTVLFAQKKHKGISNTKDTTLITSFNFIQLTGGIIVARGTIDNYQDSLNFIMDTGSSSASLDSSTCAQLHLPIKESNKYIRGVGATLKAKYTPIETLRFPGIIVNNPSFHVSNYEPLSEVYGIKIDGIIGYNFFHQYIVAFNFDSSKIYVYKQGKHTYPKDGHFITPLLNIKIPVIEVPIQNRVKINSKYYFDMGAGLCLLLSKEFTDNSNLLKKQAKRRKRVATLAQGLNGKINMQLTTIQKLKIGKYKFRNIPTYIFDDINNVTNYPKHGGLIGNDLLRRFNITLDYAANKIFLSPNSHYLELFDYSYTGFSIYFIDNAITVGDVIKNSPAEKAGLQPGDIIKSVGNNFSNNIQTYRELLKKVNTKVPIIIYRNGSPYKKEIFIKSIFK